MPDSSAAIRSDDVLKRIHNENIRSIDLQFTDVVGMVKTVTIDADLLSAALAEGIWFDGSAVEGFARIAELDMYLMPDLSTFAILSWEPPNVDGERTARILCDVYTPNGQPFAGDPRGALRRAVAMAESMDVRYVVAPELEFYLFRTPPEAGQLVPDDQTSYFDASDGTARMIRKRVSDALRPMGIVVEFQPSRGRRWTA